MQRKLELNFSATSSKSGTVALQPLMPLAPQSPRQQPQ
jgi:hypothetical protein